MYDNNETFKIHTYLALSRDAKNCKLRKTNVYSEFKKWLAWIPCWALLGLINVESRGDTPYYGLYKEAFPKS